MSPATASTLPAPLPASRHPWSLPAAYRRLSRAEAVEALRLGVTAIVSIWLAMALELSTPEWAGWTVLSVSLATRASSLQKSLFRATGSIVGAAIALLLLGCFAQDTLAFDAALAVWLGLLTVASSLERGQRSYGFALSGFTVPIIATGVLAHPDQGFAVAVDRCSTLLLGIACAHVSSVLVARPVRAVGAALADRIDDAADLCAAWLEETRSARHLSDVAFPPLRDILALDSAIAEAMVEQSSLRSGGHFISRAPNRLLTLVAEGLLMPMLPARADGRGDRLAAAALFDEPARDGVRFGWRPRLAVASRLLRVQRRLGNRYAPVRGLAIDRDGRNALNNGIRTLIAVGLVCGFGYASAWSSAATAVTWTGLLCLLLSARADAAGAARSFLLGAMLASMIGLVMHYTLLTVSGNFALLALVLLPIVMLAALGRADRRATTSTGYGMLVLSACSLHNTMQYDLAADLNGTAASLLGMSLAVVAFTALPPPATSDTLRQRARWRMARPLHALATWPRWARPTPDAFLARMSARLVILASEPPVCRHGAVVLMLQGRLLLAVGDADPLLGRKIGRLAWRGETSLLRSYAGQAHLPELQRRRLQLIAALRDDAALVGWPGLPPTPQMTEPEAEHDPSA